MKFNSTLLALLVLITFSSCHRYYTSSAFNEISARHKTVAVLPPQIIITGIQPRTIKKSDITALEETESKLFQQSLYNNILRNANRGKYKLAVSVQPYTNTLAALEQNNISIREAWTKSDQELAELLGVDAIVRSSIQKERFMSDIASAGIYTGKRILDAVVNKPVIVPVNNKTNQITATCSVVSSGETLWNDYYRRDSDWNTPATEVIENITNNFARHFPYKRKA